MILTTPDVNVVLMDFPSKKGNEMVVPNEDGSYTILINAGLNYESQLKAYEHAMSHIKAIIENRFVASILMQEINSFSSRMLIKNSSVFISTL